MQTAYAVNQAAAFAGMKATSGDDNVDTFIAQESIPFGRGVVGEAGNVYGVRLAGKDKASVTYDRDFEASNSIAFSVNGTAITPVVYGTSHAATFLALIAAIEALAGVSCVAGAGREILVEMDNGDTITVATTVTGGTNQAVGTIVYSTDDVFRGVSVATHKEQDSTGVVQYLANEAVSVLRRGRIWVETALAVTADQDAYVDMTGAIGKFTNASSGNVATGGKFRSTNSGAALAELEVNLP